MALFGRRCPVGDDERAWIDKSMSWFTETFGTGPLSAPVVLPTAEYFPDPYAGSIDDVQRELDRVCGYMGVDAARVVLEMYSERAESLPGVLLAHDGPGTAGRYRPSDDKSVVAIEATTARRAIPAIATIAHELGHVRLLGDGLISPDDRDQEPLTDLLTVYLGMGIFSANAAHQFWHSAEGQNLGNLGSWHTSRQGYLTETMYGYALARCARLRGERRPSWAEHLDTNPRVYMRKGERYLQRRTDM